MLDVHLGACYAVGIPVIDNDLLVDEAGSVSRHLVELIVSDRLRRGGVLLTVTILLNLRGSNRLNRTVILSADITGSDRVGRIDHTDKITLEQYDIYDIGNAALIIVAALDLFLGQVVVYTHKISLQNSGVEQRDNTVAVDVALRSSESLGDVINIVEGNGLRLSGKGTCRVAFNGIELIFHGDGTVRLYGITLAGLADQRVGGKNLTGLFVYTVDGQGGVVRGDRALFEARLIDRDQSGVRRHGKGSALHLAEALYAGDLIVGYDDPLGVIGNAGGRLGESVRFFNIGAVIDNSDLAPFALGLIIDRVGDRVHGTGRGSIEIILIITAVSLCDACGKGRERLSQLEHTSVVGYDIGIGL